MVLRNTNPVAAPVLAAEVPSAQNNGLSADGKSVTYKLKPGVKWADGNPFSADDVAGWDDASAPGRVGEKLERLVTRRPPPARWARPTTNVVHWATGAGWGAQYALLASRSRRHPVVVAMALGPAAWLSGYAVLPLLGVYKPIWAYDARTLADDLSAHVVYGIATAAAFAALTREKS